MVFYVQTVHIDWLLFIVIVPTCAQVGGVKLILKQEPEVGI